MSVENNVLCSYSTMNRNMKIHIHNWNERKSLLSATQTQHQVQSRLLLDVVVRKSAAILQLFAGENQTLLIRRDAFLVLDFRLNVLDGIGRFHIKRNGFAGQRLDKNLHASTQPQHQVQSRLLLDVVVRKSATILQ